MADKDILCTVIIPEYNCSAETAKRCLFGFGKYQDELEVIVIDDGSDRKWKDKIEELVSKMPYADFISQEHKGVSAARNRGLDIAKGKYISFCDIDDMIDADMLMKNLCDMENDCDLLFCDYCKVRSGNKRIIVGQ